MANNMATGNRNIRPKLTYKELIKRCCEYYNSLFGKTNESLFIQILKKNPDYIHSAHAHLTFLKNAEHFSKPNSILLIEPTFWTTVYILRCITEAEITVLFRHQNALDGLTFGEKQLFLSPCEKILFKDLTWIPRDSGYNFIMCQIETSTDVPDILKSFISINGCLLALTQSGKVLKWIRNSYGGAERAFPRSPGLFGPHLCGAINDEELQYLEKIKKTRIPIVSSSTVLGLQTPPEKQLPPEEPKISTILDENSECPICIEVLRLPIYNCKNGHNVCGICKSTIYSCPICRDQTFSRNLLLEKLIPELKSPCEGCKIKYSNRMLKLHEANCSSFVKLTCKQCESNVVIEDFTKHMADHFKYITLPSQFEKTITKQDLPTINVRSYTEYDHHIFEWSIHRTPDFLLITAKLLNSIEYVPRYQIEIKIEHQKDILVFKKYPIALDSERSLVQLPRTTLREFVKDSPFSITGNVLRL